MGFTESNPEHRKRKDDSSIRVPKWILPAAFSLLIFAVGYIVRGVAADEAEVKDKIHRDRAIPRFNAIEDVDDAQNDRILNLEYHVKDLVEMKKTVDQNHDIAIAIAAKLQIPLPPQ